MREETPSLLVGSVGGITLAPGVANETVKKFIKTKKNQPPTNTASRGGASTCWNNITIIAATKTSFVCVCWLGEDKRIPCATR